MTPFIDQIIASGTIIETATGTKEFTITAQVPFFYILLVIAALAISLAIFYLFFKSIWSE